MLQFITDIKSPVAVERQILEAIEGGCRWVEVNMPGRDDAEVARVIEAVKPRCIETETFLLLTNRVDLAKELNVGGVHLQNGEISPSSARVKLGAGAVIGVSAKDIDVIRGYKSLDLDYIRIEPVEELGESGVKSLIDTMHQEEIMIAVVVSELKNPEKVDGYLKAGANGISVSEAIAESGDITGAVKAFLSKIPMAE